MVGTLPSDSRSAGLISGKGAGIPHVSCPKGQEVGQKQYCNKFNKDFRNGPH